MPNEVSSMFLVLKSVKMRLSLVLLYQVALIGCVLSAPTELEVAQTLHVANATADSAPNKRLELLEAYTINLANLTVTQDRKEFNESKPLPVAESSIKQEQQSESDLPGSAPIYITIPIYINTSKLTPIRLTIGDQKFRSAAMRRKQSTKSPNSHFNRLLEPAKRRSSNRHRSPIASQIEAIEEPMASSTLKTNATAASN